MTPKQMYAEELIRELIGKGQIVEMGWVSLKFMALEENAPQHIEEALREAFFAGANFLLTVLPADFDPAKMAVLESELEEFSRQFSLKYGLPVEKRKTNARS